MSAKRRTSAFSQGKTCRQERQKDVTYKGSAQFSLGNSAALAIAFGRQEAKFPQHF
jgi:hypothetical protein